MQIKKLRSNTIIPDALYVQRAADRQLRLIIEDMGRPGYVLVARQMGKTNLLLNAKRNLSDENNIFVYLDVSNSFPDLHYFFRNITDVILDSSPEIFYEVGATILAKRELSTLLPHKEHEMELRMILRAVEGKLVICLDEIDALTNTGYSDQVFSLIRSIYFSGRANFPEFYRLTYILSGVAEPTDIIKNKEISPFNIGEKIYLEDFSRVEFSEFIGKTGLAFEDDIEDAIYMWTNGNPRITWDLCSAVEDIILERGNFSKAELDALVNKLYLTSFDLPPIDHIRKLVEEDKAIRGALVAIHYGKSETISDPLRNKLYLAGICNFDFKSRKIFIKNNIIEHALSESWIHQVDRNKFSIEEIGKMHFDQGNYKDALLAYLDFVSKTTENISKEWPYYYMGLSSYSLENYPDSIKYLSLYPLRKSVHGKAYFHSKTTLGRAHFLLGQYDVAAKIFEDARDSLDKDEFPYDYIHATSMLAGALFKFDNQSFSRALSLYEYVLSSSKTYADQQNEDSRWIKLIALTHSNLATLHRALGDAKNTIMHLSLAIDASAPFKKPDLLMQLAEIVEDADERLMLVLSAANCVLDNNLVIQPKHEDARPLTIDVCAAILIYLDMTTQLELINRLVEHIAENVLASKIDADVIANDLISKLLDAGRSQLAKDVLGQFLNRKEKILDPKIHRRLLSLQIVLDVKSAETYEADYLKCVETNGLIESDYDYGALFVLVTNRIDEGNIVQAAKILMLSTTNMPEVKRSKEGNIVISYLEVLTQLIVKITPEAIESAGNFLRLTSNSSTMYLPFFGSDFPSSMNKSIRTIINSSTQPIVKQVVRSAQKIGRNDVVVVRFTDGRMLSGKYKNLEMDLKSGNCELIV